MQGKDSTIFNFAQMIAVEYLKIVKELLKLMSKCGLRCDDYKHVELFEEYSRMRDKGDKTDYILAILSSKYHISESTIKRIVKRLRKEVK